MSGAGIIVSLFARPGHLQGSKVGVGQVRDVKVVADAGNIPRIVVDSEDLLALPLAEGDFQD
jgi:hypothetical protein